MDLKRGIDKAVTSVVASLNAQAEAIPGDGDKATSSHYFGKWRRRNRWSYC